MGKSALVIWMYYFENNTAGTKGISSEVIVRHSYLPIPFCCKSTTVWFGLHKLQYVTRYGFDTDLMKNYCLHTVDSLKYLVLITPFRLLGLSTPVKDMLHCTAMSAGHLTTWNNLQSAHSQVKGCTGTKAM